MIKYTNAHTGQVIESEEALPHLDALARWQRSEGGHIAEVKAPAPEPAAEPEPEPVERPDNNRKADWVKYAQYKGYNVDGLNVAEIKDLVDGDNGDPEPQD